MHILILTPSPLDLQIADGNEYVSRLFQELTSIVDPDVQLGERLSGAVRLFDNLGTFTTGEEGREDYAEVHVHALYDQSEPSELVVYARDFDKKTVLTLGQQLALSEPERNVEPPAVYILAHTFIDMRGQVKGRADTPFYMHHETRPDFHAMCMVVRNVTDAEVREYFTDCGAAFHVPPAHPTLQ